MLRPRSLSLLLLAALIAVPDRARGEERERPERPERWEPGPLPAAAALVPGLAVSGAGHYVAGDREVAVRLLALEGIGLGAAAAGGLSLYLTGASRRASGPSIELLVGGIGLFAISWIADVYGAAGGARIGGEPRRRPPRLEIDLGYGFLGDPQFSFEHFAALEAEARFGPWRIGPSGWIAVDGDNQRGRVEVARRLLGAGSRHPLGDGSFFEIEGALTHHRYGGEQFASSLAEVFVGGRYDMGRLGSTLAGSFAELGGGVGLELIDFDVSGADSDLRDLLLARFAYGVYLGTGDRYRGELSLYYDHRRDGFPGGLSPMRRNGSGFAGHFGLGGFLDVGPRWGASLDLALGAAFVARAGLRYRFGGDG